MTNPTTIPATTDPEVDARYALVEQAWGELQNAVRTTRALPVDFSSPEFVENMRTIRERSLTGLSEMNAAVTVVQGRSAERAAFGRNLQYGALALATVTFVFALIYIRRNITGPITQVIGKLNEGAVQVNGAAAQVSDASQQLAEGASEQASSLEETSAALEEMAAMTRTNAENSKQANELSGRARVAAEGSDATMNQLNDAMSAINESSGKISKIIKVIEEIAFQTNLLALNAAVEAARAGEHGKGFAVVADEVRNLAQRAAQAARETTGLIEDSVSKAGEGTEVAGKVGDALGAIAGDVTKVATLISGITQASEEQAQGVDQVNTAVSQMDRVTQQNAAGAEESAAASEQLSAQASEVQRVVEELATVIGGQSLDASRRVSTQQHGSLHGGHASAKTPSRKNRVKAVPSATPSSATAQANDPVGSDEEFMSLDGEGMKSF